MLEQALLLEAARLQKVISGLNKKIKTLESKPTNKKKKKASADISEEEMAYRKAMEQMATNIEDSESSEDESK